MSLAFKFLNGYSCCLILPSWSGEDCNNWKKGIDLNAWGLEGRPKFGISYQLNIQEFLPILGNTGVFHINTKLASLITGTCHGFHPLQLSQHTKAEMPSIKLQLEGVINPTAGFRWRWLESEAFSAHLEVFWQWKTGKNPVAQLLQFYHSPSQEQMGLSRRLNFFPAAPSSVGTRHGSSETFWVTWWYLDFPGYVAEVTSNAMVWTQKYLLGLMPLFWRGGLGAWATSSACDRDDRGKAHTQSGTKVEHLNSFKFRLMICQYLLVFLEIHIPWMSTPSSADLQAFYHTGGPSLKRIRVVPLFWVQLTMWAIRPESEENVVMWILTCLDHGSWFLIKRLLLDGSVPEG